MRVLKKFLRVNSYIIVLPQPCNISYLLNFGFLLAFCLVRQMVTDVTRTMQYNPSELQAFNSIGHIFWDAYNGLLTRYIH